MSEIQLHAESYGALLLLPQVPCLMVRWHGFANSRNLRQLLNKALELYQQYAPRYPRLGWVSDARRFGAMLPADQDWAAVDWNRRAYAAGIRRAVFISPNNVFGQIALQQLTHKMEQAAYLRITHVASPEAAWQQVLATA
ncbi:hypothetical protein ACFPAF_04435 [Hymenobacter endophyticus]|uniref:Uncharacterized protein n=1 Tax=Hymenobacter endophyticus TaxID=3076335 RepID=A0ABU3TE32_9BACT|nr:hypothetical protein [Hymenobacter endophyticus]MDU0369632.1 hypothetical protein [Hymenobacter endophyticus]